MRMVRIQNTVELSKDFQRSNENLIGVVSERMIMIVKRSAKAALAVNAGLGGIVDPSSDMLVVDLDDKVVGDSIAKATANRRSDEIED